MGNCIEVKKNSFNYHLEGGEDLRARRKEYVRLGISLAILATLSTILVEYTHAEHFQELMNRAFSTQTAHKGYLALLNATAFGGGFLVIQQLKKQKFFGVNERIKAIFRPPITSPERSLLTPRNVYTGL